MIELNGIQISDNNINTKKNVKIYTDEKQLSNVVDKEVHALKEALKDLHTPIAISTENTTESKAQNVRNIADFVAKAKAAGIDTTKSFRLTLEIDGYPVEGSYDTHYKYVYGLRITDEELADYFVIDGETGYALINSIVATHTEQRITSFMLDEGARKPIILTTETTEVDEETYQKLLSDDVDVVFKDEMDNLCAFIGKEDIGSSWKFYFTVLSGNTDIPEFIYLSAYEAKIVKNGVHKCTIGTNIEWKSIDEILTKGGYLNKSTLSPVLQEIDLTGTDAQRKAKLDQFETDWKALTGANDMTGARFVGKITTPKDALASVLFVYNDGMSTFTGVTNYDDSNYRNHYSVYLNSEGALTVTPLFSHLEPIPIKTGNTTEDKAANVAAIKAYVDNLVNLGFSLGNGGIIPVTYIEEQQKYHGLLFYRNDTSVLNGIVSKKFGGAYYNLSVDKNDGSTTSDAEDPVIFNSDLSPIKASIEHLATCMNFTETPSSNKILLELYLNTVPNAQVMHCTYKDVYAGTLHKIGTDWFGLLVKNTNNYEDAIQVKLQADGTLIEGTTSLAQVNAKLDTIMG